MKSFLLLIALLAFLPVLATAQITPGGSCNASIQPYGCNYNSLYYCPNATWQIYDNCTSYSPMRYCDYSPTAGACVASPVVKPGSYCTSGTGCYNNEYLTCVGNQWNETQNCTATNQSCSLGGCVGAGQEIPGSSCNPAVKPYMCYQNGLYHCPSGYWMLNQNCTATVQFCSYSQTAGSCLNTPQNIPGSACSAGTMCYENKLYSCQGGYWLLQEDCQTEGKYCAVGACYLTPQYTPGAYCNPNVTAFMCYLNDLYYCPTGTWSMYQSCGSLHCVASNTSGTCSPVVTTTSTIVAWQEPELTVCNTTEMYVSGTAWMIPFCTPFFWMIIIMLTFSGGFGYVVTKAGASGDIGAIAFITSTLLFSILYLRYGVFELWVGVVVVVGEVIGLVYILQKIFTRS